MGVDATIVISVLVIIFYLIVFNFLKSKIRNKRLRILLSSIIAVVFGFILYIVLIVSSIYFLTREESREFNKEDWSISNDNVDNELSKYEMIDDLIDSEILLNKDSVKVKSILGIPDSRNFQQKNWTYNAGTGGGFGFVDHFLDIYFHDNKVIRAEHKRIND